MRITTTVSILLLELMPYKKNYTSIMTNTRTKNQSNVALSGYKNIKRKNMLRQNPSN
jgi:hypothetical protein